MVQESLVVDCQSPSNSQYIKKAYNIVRCELQKGSNEYNSLLETAKQLASDVNSGAANNSDFNRDLQRRIIDSFGGVCAEYAWEKYINSIFGEIASPTPFSSASVQIDIKLRNGELIEVRSSFPRNGVRFAICHERYNFKNIGSYSNTVKPGEIQKDFYLSVLFDTGKSDLLRAEKVELSLIGGSTFEMMKSIGQNVNLKPEDDSFATESTYRVIYLKDALDVNQIIEKINQLGYPKSLEPAL